MNPVKWASRPPLFQLDLFSVMWYQNAIQNYEGLLIESKTIKKIFVIEI